MRSINVKQAQSVLQEKGFIYLSKHEGWYAVSDETFYPASAVHLIVDPPTGRKMMVTCHLRQLIRG